MAILRILAPDEGTRIEVLDPSLQPIALSHNTREVKLDVTPGLYAVRFRRGLAVTEKLTDVGKDGISVALEQSEEPVFATAAPVLQAGEEPSPQQRAAERLSRASPRELSKASQNNGSLLLFFRCDGPFKVRLDSGVTLHREDARELTQVEQIAEADSDAGWAGLHLSLPAGAYRLRRKLDTTSLEQILHIRPSWQTQFFAKVLAQEQAPAVDFMLQSVLMRPTSEAFDGSRPEGRYAEAALRALRERSSIPGGMSEAMLEGKFENPIVGVIAALLQLRRPDLEFSALRQVVDNLLLLLGTVPDVLALGLALMTREPKLRDDQDMRSRFCVPAALAVPPYFSESWRHIVEANHWEPRLIPVDSLSARVSASVAGTKPWFRWRMTDELATAPAVANEKRGLFAKAARAVLNLFGITPETIENFTVEVLSRTLKTIQDTLSRFDKVDELLASSQFDDFDRRIAGFVYPLTDVALLALLEAAREHAAALRKSVLARGQDGRELSRVLQLPLGTAILNSMGLQYKLLKCLEEASPSERIEKFIERESHGNESLRAALHSLASMPTPARHIGIRRGTDALEYMVLRYAPAPPNQAPKLPLVDLKTQQPITSKLDRQILSEARKLLGEKVSHLIANGTLLTNEKSHAKLVATLRDYLPGRLFPTLRWPQDEPKLQLGPEKIKVPARPNFAAKTKIHRKPRIGRNPVTGEKVILKAKTARKKIRKKTKPNYSKPTPP